MNENAASAAMNAATPDVLSYLRGIQPPLPSPLSELHARAMRDGYPVISPETARLLALLVTLAAPRSVLEIGCAIGFSAALFAEFMGEGGRVTTIDRYPHMIHAARRNFRELGLEGRVELLEGDAADILPTLTGAYDMIFLDAAKAQYMGFLKDCLRLLREGGLFIADDVLQGGGVASELPEVERRRRTTMRRMDEFLRAASGSGELFTSVVPVGDGLLLGIKMGKDERHEKN